MNCAKGLISTLILVAQLTPAYATDPCVLAVGRILSNSKLSSQTSQALESAEKILGHPFNTKQQAAIEKALEITGGDIYTARELAEQNRILKKAEFSESDIEKLRKSGVLGNSVLSLVNGSPAGVDFLTVSMQELNSNIVKDLKRGETYHYLIGEHGHIYATKDELSIAADHLAVVSSKESVATENLTSFVVREGGDLSFDPVTKNFTFHPLYGFDHNAEDVKGLIERMHETNPGTTVTYKPNPTIPPSRVLKCLDLVSAQSNGKNFVLDRMLTDNAVTTIALGSSELAGAGRLKTKEGQQIIESDLVGGNVNGVIGAAVGKKLVIQNSSFLTSMGIRTGMGLGMIEIQKNITKQMVDGKSSEVSAGDIAAFNRVHFFARLPLNHAIDQFMVKSLPTMIFNTCQKYPTLSLAVGPKAVRL